MLALNSKIDLGKVYFSEREGRNMVVSVDFGTWTTCSKETVTFLKLFEYGKTFEDIANLTQMSYTELEERIKKYFDKGFLKVDNKMKFKELNVNSMVLNANTVPQLCILHVSNICNLSCKYCYAHTDENLKKSMSLEVMLNSIERFMELPTEYLTVEFHGGEPLLQHQKIAKACAYAVELSKTCNKTLTFALQSNMTFINEEVIETLVKYKIKLRISLDGLRDMNDYYRVDNEESGSFDRIVENLKRLNDHNIFPEVVTVVTKRNVDHLPEIFEFFATLNLTRIRLMPLWSQGMGKTMDEAVVEPEYLEKKYISLIDWIVKYNKKTEDKNQYIKMLVLSKEIEAICTFKRSFMCLRCPCGAGINMVDVSISGDVYPCEEMNECNEFKIGSIFENSIMHLLTNSQIVEKLKSRNPDRIEECRSCPWKRHCQSGCANKNYQKYGAFETKSEKCRFYKNYFEDLIWYLDKNKDCLQYLV